MLNSCRRWARGWDCIAHLLSRHAQLLFFFPALAGKSSRITNFSSSHRCVTCSVSFCQASVSAAPSPLCLRLTSMHLLLKSWFKRKRGHRIRARDRVRAREFLTISYISFTQCALYLMPNFTTTKRCSPQTATTHCRLSLHVAAAVAARCCLCTSPPARSPSKLL